MSNQTQVKAEKIPLTVWVLGFASMLTDVSTELIHAILPNFMTSVLHASFIDIGLIEGLAETLASLLKVFSGVWSDRIGKRKGLLLVGYGLSALVKPLYLFANSIVIVLLARLADRVGKGLRGAPRDALVADVTSAANRGRAYGLRQSLDTCGAVLGPLLALLLMWLSQSNYQLAFAVALIPAFAVVLLLYFGVKEPVRKSVANADKLFDAKLLAELKAKMPPQFFYLVATVFLFSLANSSDAFLLLKARDCGLSLVACPLVLVAINISYALSAYPAGILSDRVGHGRLLAIAFLLYAVTYLGFAFVTQQSLMLLLCLVYGLYLGLSQGVISALVSQLTPGHLRGTAFGIVNFAVGLALLPASLLTGFLYQYFGALVAFATCALIALLAALILALQLPGLRQAQAALVSD